MFKLTSFKYYIYLLIFALSITNMYAQNIYSQNDTLNISKCNTKQWCKISNSQSWVKLFRLKKVNDNAYKVKAKGDTYSYTFIEDLSYGKINKFKNSISSIDDTNIQKDLKFGYIRNTLIQELNIRQQVKKKEIIPNKILENIQDTEQSNEIIDSQIDELDDSKSKVNLEREVFKEKYFPKQKNVEEEHKSNSAEQLYTNNINENNLNKQKHKQYNNSNIFQSVSLLYENYDLNRVDINAINHPDDTSSFGVGYKIGQEKDNYRYYVNARIASGIEALISADYLSKSNIFAGLSVGYGAIKLNSNSTYIKGALYGLQVGYRFKSFEFSLQRLKSNMKVTDNFVDYSVDYLNYFSIDYRF